MASTPPITRASCRAHHASIPKQPLTAYFEQPGGQVPTALVALQRWGLRTAYVGPFADDVGARRQRASLEEEGVHVVGTQVRVRTGGQTSIILVD